MDLGKFDLKKVFGAFGGRKFVALVGVALMHFGGYTVPMEMWGAVGAYVLGQGLSDGLSKGKTSTSS